MKCAIMQPYFFPYVGYFQLMAAVDTFVFYDDVNFIKKGWIARNRLLLDGKAHLFTLSIEKMSQNRLIMDHELVAGLDDRERILTLVRRAYLKAPEFEKVFPLIEKIMLYPEKRLSYFLIYGLIEIARHLDISTRFLISSNLEKSSDAKGFEKILEILDHLRAAQYVNPIGGVALYDKNVFESRGVQLFFLQTRSFSYSQFSSGEFIPFLSIIDLLMFNRTAEIKEQLTAYDLI